MTISDPIADMLTRIRNAAKAKFNSVDIPGSRLKTEMARVLQEQGFIRNYKLIKDNKQGVLRIYLKYDGNQQGVIMGLERISRPSRRVYVKGAEVRPVLNGMGVMILSTSRGIMTDKQARQHNLGGEVLAKVW
ncbi:MAG TPA: 30S ribosomal protein S8 [Desulfobacteraceae bacterium]|nr:30S ribosomal protein S8 [Deltaproteobacteria bacterium]MBW2355373.1 30S ribosomal protein S8 [Deltaproteobacteria bacterium]HDI61091.1 30S ribosomal protein S8 [Desulfobacteraceae bacterium]